MRADAWLPNGLLSGSHLTPAWGKGVQTLPGLQMAAIETNPMADAESNEFFDWSGQYGELLQWKCQSCPRTQH
eukprot:2510770-Rhodomonas_salina.1